METPVSSPRNSRTRSGASLKGAEGEILPSKQARALAEGSRGEHNRRGNLSAKVGNLMVSPSSPGFLEHLTRHALLLGGLFGGGRRGVFCLVSRPQVVSPVWKAAGAGGLTQSSMGVAETKYYPLSGK
jgi:hypothetical protein